MKQRADRLLLRIYFAPYGRTDNMDVDLSGIIEGTKTIEESGKMLLDEIVQVCNGKLTKAEAYGFSDIAVDHVCRFV